MGRCGAHLFFAVSTMTTTMMMQAIAIAQPGGPEVLRPVERPRPQPAAGEVLIRVQAAGVNRPDVLQRLGAYTPPPGASELPGLEVAGTIFGGDAAGGGV
jgi:NADPH2:quinone reductase